MRDLNAFAMLLSSEEAREMQSHHSTFMRAVSIAAVCAFLLAGCTQTYIYSSDQMPKIVKGNLLVRDFERSHAATDSYEIDRVGVRHASVPGLLRAPTEAELNALLSGGTLDNYVIELDVDTSRTHWRDYGLGGAGIGVSLGVVASLSEQNNNLFGDSQLGLLFVSVLLGSMGFMAGLIGGSLTAPDFVDMRYTEEFDPQ
jgi:hypothetical protein